MRRSAEANSARRVSTLRLPRFGGCDRSHARAEALFFLAEYDACANVAGAYCERYAWPRGDLESRRRAPTAFGYLEPPASFFPAWWSIDARLSQFAAGCFGPDRALCGRLSGDGKYYQRDIVALPEGVPVDLRELLVYQLLYIFHSELIDEAAHD
jgi:hypothetical protein